MKHGDKEAVEFNNVSWWPILISLVTATAWFLGYLMSTTHFSVFGIDVSKFAVFTDYFMFFTINFSHSLFSFFMLLVTIAIIKFAWFVVTNHNTWGSININVFRALPIVLPIVFIALLLNNFRIMKGAAIDIKQGYIERYNIVNHNTSADCVAIIGNAGPYTAIWDYETKAARLIKTDDISTIEYAIGIKKCHLNPKTDHLMIYHHPKIKLINGN